MNPLPVLACEFFKINYLLTSENTSFLDSRSNIDNKARYYNYCDEHWQKNKFFI